MNETQLVIEDHAYKRYCQRVGYIDREELTEKMQEKIYKPDRRKNGYIQLDGVWWRYSRASSVVTLHTCYGRHHIDLPEAIRWAKRFGDRIDLNEGVQQGGRW